ncbi:hypothetical protein MO973_01415 [Paenibacillus sp. TRM 82003]|nr:hypothetical protein [Paenibacillus sp. TRM 82003]
MKGWNKQRNRCAVGLAALSMLLAACSSQAATGSEYSMGSQEASEPLSGIGKYTSLEAGEIEADVLIEESSSPLVAEGVDRTSEQGEEYVVSLPERGISLYQVDEGGVFLAIGERKQQMDWIYTTPRLIMPRLQADDYDRDGEDELAVALHIGSGTGVAVDELHIVELPAEIAPDDQPFVDRVFLPELIWSSFAVR